MISAVHADVHRKAVRSELALDACVHPAHPLNDLRGAEKLIAGELDRADLVLSCLGKVEADDHFPRCWLRQLRLAFELEINIAVVAVKLRQLFLVLLQDLVFEEARSEEHTSELQS